MESSSLPPTRSGPPSASSFWTETSREYLDVYGEYVHGHRAAPHHRIWTERIQALIEGRSAKRRLLLIAPPGFAKSTWLSLIFPPWYLGRHPDHSVLFFTSSDVMASQFGNTVKATLDSSERHAAVFPAAECRADAGRGWSADGLYLKGIPQGSKDPSYRAVGYGASVIGARAHGIILDDPLTQDSARSAAGQLHAKSYFKGTVDTRLHPTGWMLAIMTRWHLLDLASDLIAKEDWDVCHMPALVEQDDGSYRSLWPNRFSVDFLMTKKRDGVADFNCLYQGDPTAMGGSVFKEASWFRPFPKEFTRQRLARVVQYWDLNYSSRDSADYSVGLTLGLDRDGNLYVLDVWRGRLEEKSQLAAIQERVSIQRPQLLGVEEAAYRQAATADLVNRLFRARVNVPVQAVRVTTDKVFRSQLPAGRGQAGMLFADTQAPWFPDFVSECLSFPLGTNDDQVDALSGAVQLALGAPESSPQMASFGGR